MREGPLAVRGDESAGEATGEARVKSRVRSGLRPEAPGAPPLVLRILICRHGRLVRRIEARRSLGEAHTKPLMDE